MDKEIRIPEENKKIPGIWAFPVLFAAGLLIAFLFSPVVDNDTWWILAIGKNIINNGIPTVEPLAMHEGLDFIAQQWLSSVIFRGIFDVFGYMGLAALCRLLDFAILFLLFKLCRIVGLDSKAASFATVLAGVPLIVVFGVLRPQMFTFIILLSEVIFLEKYVKTNKWQWLLPLPVLSALEINLHSSMWFMTLVFILPFAAESLHDKMIKLIKRKNYEEWSETKAKLPKVTYRFWPIAAAFVITAIAGILNPYGLKAMTYVFRSYGVEIINKVVSEMMPMSFGYAAWAFVYVIIGVILICASKGRKPIRYVCFTIGCSYLALAHTKGFAYFLLFVVPIVGYCFRDKEFSLHLFKKPIIADKYKKPFAIILCVCAMVVVFGKDVFMTTHNDITDLEMYGCKEVLVYAEENTDINEESKIFAGYNTGGYLEYKGYKPYLDARAEVFLKENNLKKDYFTEYTTAEYSAFGALDLLKEYKFDYIFIETSSSIHQWLKYLDEDGSGDYVLVYVYHDETYSSVSPLALWVNKNISEDVRIDASAELELKGEFK